MTNETRVLSITVARPLAAVCDYLFDPRNFPQWASGLASGLAPVSGDALKADPALWTAQTPQGEVTVRFTPPNDYGVADHWVFPSDGTIVYVPLRAIANGSGAEVSLMLFRLPSMSPKKYEEDAQWVMRDLQRLKTALEAAAGGPEPGADLSRVLPLLR